MQGLEYSVDLVFVIDKTGSMSPIINRVKANALKFDSDLKKYMEAKKRPINSLRVRVIGFGDIYADGSRWLTQSDFFDLPSQSRDFHEFVNSISADGGGDEPESGLEALAIAFQSSWTDSGAKRRHVIALWTDTTAHPLEMRGSRSLETSASVPVSFSAMFDLWNNPQIINQNNKRLVLFAPDTAPWTDIYNDWSLVTHPATQAGEGLKEVDYNIILEEIANSI